MSDQRAEHVVTLEDQLQRGDVALPITLTAARVRCPHNTRTPGTPMSDVCFIPLSLPNQTKFASNDMPQRQVQHRTSAFLNRSSAASFCADRKPWLVYAFPKHHSASCFLGSIVSACWNFDTAASTMSDASSPGMKLASSSRAPPQRVNAPVSFGFFLTSDSALDLALSKKCFLSSSDESMVRCRAESQAARSESVGASRRLRSVRRSSRVYFAQDCHREHLGPPHRGLSMPLSHIARAQHRQQ
jgi:hypothetical protein